MRYYEIMTEARPQPVNPDVIVNHMKADFKHVIFNKKRYMQDKDVSGGEHQSHLMIFSYSEWLNDINERLFEVGHKGNRCQIVMRHMRIVQLWKELVSAKMPDDPDMEEFNYNQNQIDYYVLSSLIKKYLKKFEKMGWFVFRVSLGKTVCKIIFESYYGNLVPNVPQYLYHFSALWNKDRILRKGLIPKKSAGDWGYPPRVFLLDRLNMNHIRSLAWSIWNKDLDMVAAYQGLETADVPILVIFKIDTSKVRKGTKFYTDGDAGSSEEKFGGVWTYTHIPPEALSVIHEDDPEEEERKPS